MTRKLLVLNYVMDESHPIFGHQIQAVKVLSRYFDEITVVTGKAGNFDLPPWVTVISSGWVSGKKLQNTLNFYLKVIPILVTPRIQVFSHMTEVQSALIAPLTKLLRIRHLLWYAHTSNSVYVRWCHFWLTGIVTSTLGSSPIISRKVFAIGQGIDPEDFPVVPLLAETDRTKFVHFGRFDPSKNIDELVRTCCILRDRGFAIQFRQIGSASTRDYESAASSLRYKYHEAEWVKFFPSIARSQISAETQTSSAFLHAFQGSLDKTLVEATMQEMPVLTINKEYLNIFGSWTGEVNPSLLQESEYFLQADIKEIREKVKQRRVFALENHGLNNWANAISVLFK